MTLRGPASGDLTNGSLALLLLLVLILIVPAGSLASPAPTRFAPPQSALASSPPSGQTAVSHVAAASNSSYTFHNWSYLCGAVCGLPPAGSFAYDRGDGYFVMNTVQLEGQSTFVCNTSIMPRGNWTTVFTTTSSKGPCGGSLVYDSADKYLFDNGGGASDMMFRAGLWSNVTTNTQPGAGPMVYDSADGYVFMYTYQSDWSYKNGTWKNLVPPGNPPVYPPMTSGWGLAYDAIDGYVIAFGGAVPGGHAIHATNQTWKYSGGKWTNLTRGLSPTPFATSSAILVYDGSLHGVLTDSLNGANQPSFVFSGGIWNRTQIAVLPVPTPGTGGRPILLAYSNKTGQLIYLAQQRAGMPDAKHALLGPGGPLLTYSLVGNAWQLLAQPQVSPPGRSDPAMSFDGRDNYTLIFGGSAGNPLTGAPNHPLGDTWTLKGENWTQLYPSLAPSARYGATAVYDPVSGYLVVYGGFNGRTYLNDTWTFKGGAWAKLATPSAPSPRDFYAMTYDGADREILLFGGWNGFTYFGDTWALSGGHWSNITANLSSSPSARNGAAMRYDAADGYVVLVGGLNPNFGYYLGDTWSFSGGNWTQVALTGPSPGAGAFMTVIYDPTAHRLLMFYDESFNSPVICFGSFSAGVWSSFGLSQKLSPTAPAPRYLSGLSFDPTSGAIFLFGGNLDDSSLWSY